MRSCASPPSARWSPSSTLPAALRSAATLGSRTAAFRSARSWGSPTAASGCVTRSRMIPRTRRQSDARWRRGSCPPGALSCCLGDNALVAGVVYLVGAGPGDPGLMTRRALELIAEADVVLYDRLIPPGALDGSRPDAELRYVGKEPGRPALPQEEINSLLIALARSGKTVVRLKGGDPFVFGRGGEEAEALARADVPFEVVPGVTAGVAASAYAGIPVTHRDAASAGALVTR